MVIWYNFLITVLSWVYVTHYCVIVFYLFSVTYFFVNLGPELVVKWKQYVDIFDEYCCTFNIGHPNAAWILCVNCYFPFVLIHNFQGLWPWVYHQLFSVFLIALNDSFFRHWLFFLLSLFWLYYFCFLDRLGWSFYVKSKL